MFKIFFNSSDASKFNHILRIMLYTVLIILPCSDFLILLLSYVNIYALCCTNKLKEVNRARMCDLIL